MTEPSPAPSRTSARLGISERSSIIYEDVLWCSENGQRTLITEECKGVVQKSATSAYPRFCRHPVPTPAAAVHKGAIPRKVVRIKELEL